MNLMYYYFSFSTYSPCNVSKESTFYQSVREELISSDELYCTAINTSVARNSESSENFYSITEQWYVKYLHNIV